MKNLIWRGFLTCTFKVPRRQGSHPDQEWPPFDPNAPLIGLELAKIPQYFYNPLFLAKWRSKTFCYGAIPKDFWCDHMIHRSGEADQPRGNKSAQNQLFLSVFLKIWAICAPSSYVFTALTFTFIFIISYRIMMLDPPEFICLPFWIWETSSHPGPLGAPFDRNAAHNGLWPGKISESSYNSLSPTK